MSEAARFFTTDDPRIEEMIYPLPATWWSRGYEYAWCARFVQPGEVILDAASGVLHPFKFWCAAQGATVHACDINPDILKPVRQLNPGVILQTELPADAIETLARLEGGIRNSCRSVDDLAQPDAFFDKIFCISVLEHLPAEGAGSMAGAMRAFHRVLKPGGLLLLTFDVPLIRPADFRHAAVDAGFTFCGAFDDTMPENAVHSAAWGLRCFRAACTR
ncbi:MAG: class I SAM-dependent methyltransferase [Oscillospiraceae bacterium]|jgi:SAM-dependent methyltransferase|nr:class I SAM-dependent methyltransferase [Oscillospiraceae bacterium]